MESILYSRIKELCQKRGITITKLESDLGFGNSSIKKWRQLTSPSVDKVIKITDDEAFEASRSLALHEGILAGSSSGAALAAALKLAEEIEEGNIVTVFPDRGDRYLSKGLFD